MTRDDHYVLALSCPETAGIVHEVSGFLTGNGCDIVDNRQHGDRRQGWFSMRVEFTKPSHVEVDGLRHDFHDIGVRFGMDWRLESSARRPRLLVMASRAGHCLNDLLYRCDSATLSADVALVVSNHPDLAHMADAHGVPFLHIPVSETTKPQAEARLVEALEQYRIDLVVLARYMQVLSDDLCERLSGRAINIHHSVLPSFKGARPYQQAFDRGVKFVGATAHYVTAELDEGPIIEQELVRIDHTYEPDELAKVGRDAECLALSRAVRWHCESRVFRHGSRTVVFH